MSSVTGKVVDNHEHASNQKIITCTGRYIELYRKLLDMVIDFSIELIIFLVSIVGMLTTAVAQFDNLWLFAITIVLAIAATVAIEYKRTTESRQFFEKARPHYIKRDEQRNICINMKSSCEHHSNWMVRNYLDTLQQVAKMQIRHGSTGGKLNVATSAVGAIVIIVVIVESIASVGFDNVDVTDFMKIVSLAAIFASILQNIGYRISGYQRIVSGLDELAEEMPLFEKVMKVYDEYQAAPESEMVVLKPFVFENAGKNFTLKNEKTFLFNKGEMTLVRGPSGAGKSTMFSILAGDMFLGDMPKLKAIRYSSKGELGCESILDEITLGNVNREKLIFILKGVLIYEDLVKKAEGQDLLEYLKSIRAGMSTGMGDRLLLARLLYNLDEYDLVLIDEPIGGLDAERARKVVAFIREYAAEKMQKVVLVTTHQYYEVQDMFDRFIDVEMNGRVSKIV